MRGAKGREKQGKILRIQEQGAWGRGGGQDEERVGGEGGGDGSQLELTCLAHGIFMSRTRCSVACLLYTFAHTYVPTLSQTRRRDSFEGRGVALQ
ncbi:hypothetical protein CEXT_488541 [Caerostris extrusa]|uniref:Uncharacterized protein n=1 Tax=Caerostris extrusa TaxID=172846 RepID=A0AAV4VKU7_CAEEX|nr:hypothetical protein CEXT_488541 [Caerostris extrusa]